MGVVLCRGLPCGMHMAATVRSVTSTAHPGSDSYQNYMLGWRSIIMIVFTSSWVSQASSSLRAAAGDPRRMPSRLFLCIKSSSNNAGAIQAPSNQNHPAFSTYEGWPVPQAVHTSSQLPSHAAVALQIWMKPVHIERSPRTPQTCKLHSGPRLHRPPANAVPCVKACANSWATPHAGLAYLRAAVAGRHQRRLMRRMGMRVANILRSSSVDTNMVLGGRKSPC
jgi:hypothetical protein